MPRGERQIFRQTDRQRDRERGRERENRRAPREFLPGLNLNEHKEISYGVDAETSLSLSLHLYLSSRPLHFILTLTFGQ